MNIDEIRKNAPPWATKYYLDDDGEAVPLFSNGAGQICYAYTSMPIKRSDLVIIRDKIKPL